MLRHDAQGPARPQVPPWSPRRSPSCSASPSWPARSCSPTRSARPSTTCSPTSTRTPTPSSGSEAAFEQPRGAGRPARAGRRLARRHRRGGRRRRRGRRRSSRATPSSSTTTATPIGDPEMGAPTFGGNWTDSDELNPFTLVDGRPARGRRRGRHRQEERRRRRLPRRRHGHRAGPGPAAADAHRRHRQVRRTPTAPAARPCAVHDRGGAAARGRARQVRQHRGRWPTRASPRRSSPTASRAALPAGVEVVTGEEITEESQDDIQETCRFFNMFMLIFAVVALLVGCVHHLQHVLDHRRPAHPGERAAAGASARAGARSWCSVLLEALIVGFVASLIGLGGGPRWSPAA